RGNGHTHVFLNTRGEPWTMTAVRQQVYRLKHALGLSDDLCAYLARHGFGTRAILNGVKPAELAELMGHSSLEKVSKAYVEQDDQHEHLQQAIAKVNSGSTPVIDGENQARKRAKPVNPKKPGRKKRKE